MRAMTCVHQSISDSSRASTSNASINQMHTLVDNITLTKEPCLGIEVVVQWIVSRSSHMELELMTKLITNAEDHWSPNGPAFAK